MSSQTTVTQTRSRHSDCMACGQAIGMRYIETECEISGPNSTWGVGLRKCISCEYEDYTACNEETNEIVVMARPGTLCKNCSDFATVTVVIPPSSPHENHSFAHYCPEHGSRVQNELRNYLDKSQMERVARTV